MAIKEFISKHWYIFKCKDNNKMYFVFVQGMKFMLDGRPHQCNEGDGCNASFYDSPSPHSMFYWNYLNSLEDFYDVTDIKIDFL